VCMMQAARITKRERSVSIQGKKSSPCDKERLGLTRITGYAAASGIRDTAFGTASSSFLEVERIGPRHCFEDDNGECDEDREVEFELHCRYCPSVGEWCIHFGRTLCDNCDGAVLGYDFIPIVGLLLFELMTV
jgi:hypothetical protein